MLSFGMEYDRAFSIAFCSARFAAGSPPPSFAATMIARVSFEKSLPRFASAAPFLCLIVDHLLCPDTRLLPYLIQEQLVNARVVGELGMERSHEDRSLPREHRMAVDLGEHLDVGTGGLDPGRTNEDRAQRLVAVPDVEICLEALHLPAESVSLRADIDEPEVVPVEDDHAGARPEDRRVEPSHRLVEAVEPHQPHDRGRLAARQDQPVEPLELLGQAHLDRLGAEAPQHGRVLAEVSLHGEHADSKRLLHDANCRGGYAVGRLARRCESKPRSTMAKPTTAKTSGGTHPRITTGMNPDTRDGPWPCDHS